jgi:hypothetical protein
VENFVFLCCEKESFYALGLDGNGVFRRDVNRLKDVSPVNEAIKKSKLRKLKTCLEEDNERHLKFEARDISRWI